MTIATLDTYEPGEFCGACGAQVDPANRFCPSCGAALPSKHDVAPEIADASVAPIETAAATRQNSIQWWVIVFFVVFVGALGAILIVAFDGLENGVGPFSIAQGPGRTVVDNIKAQVAADAAKEYALIPESDKMSRCVHAQATAEAYLQAQDQDNYTQWHFTQGIDCIDAGVPH